MAKVVNGARATLVGQEIKGQGHKRPKYVTKIPFGETAQGLSDYFNYIWKTHIAVNVHCVTTTGCKRSEIKVAKGERL